MTYVIMLHDVTQISWYFACLTAGFWAGDIVGSFIIRETPTKEHILNLLGAVLLALSCSIILCLYY